MLATRSARATLQGRRRINQDSILDTLLPDGRHVLALADGIGGQSAGEVASAMATEVLASELAQGKQLLEASLTANRAVFEAAQLDPAHAGMGTTLVALLRTGSSYQIVNVGDSRAYRIDRSEILRITEDHSFAAEAARAGHLSAEEVARSPWRNALTRSFGTGPEIDMDVYGPFDASGAPHAILLCSDGVHGVLPDSVIRDVLLAAASPEAAVEALTALALTSQSRDNISAALVEFGSLLGGQASAPPRPLSQAQGSGRDRTATASPSGGGPARVPASTAGTSPEAGEAMGSPRQRRSRSPSKLWSSLTSDAALFKTAVGGFVLWLLLSLFAG